ncbi:putative lipoprotein [Cricetibacter osteomyelitidis]|uniref:Putative lipoprotein n=1 Tax=Cricetibacter osteomyelitidis TaxID=1521931 RepID=A0A4R2SXN1_9PAST|nr:YajG family lipoprotein [Cricetibacter osteomyelitidis]TCP93224.1 putative lipoprotein [Cricetibacter osteomyelitidis]
MLKSFKTLSVASIIAGSLALTACQTPSNTLSFSVPSPTLSQFNLANQSNVVLNVVTKDERSKPEVSSYVRSNQIQTLSASPEPVRLFQQIFQQDFNSKGFRLGTPSASNTNVLINIKHFYAQVDEGNLRYKVSSKIQLEVHIQGSKGNFTKNIGGTKTYEGAFAASNENIQNVLNDNLKEVAEMIYKDQELADAIRRYN